MAITFEQLQEFLKKADLRYYIAPDEPVARFITLGNHGKHDITVTLQLEGQFLQFRTMGYHACPAGHAHILPMLKLLGEMNFKRRLVKFGWDPSDGEIMMYADLWLVDNSMTSAQFDRMIGTFLSSVDIGTLRIQAVLETGNDPGDPDYAAAKKKPDPDRKDPAGGDGAKSGPIREI